MSFFSSAKAKLAASKLAEEQLYAHAAVQKIHQLAANTLATVRVASDLLTMMKSAESMLQEVLSLQTPELHPFENLDLQREFETVTMRLQQAA